MAGVCVATVKVIGVSSLGLLTGSISLNAYQEIPNLINKLNLNIVSVLKASTIDSVLNLISVSKLTALSLGTLSSALLSLAYVVSPPKGKHPYLIYAALGAPVALFSAYYQSVGAERKLIERRRRSTKKVAAPVPVVDDEAAKEAEVKDSDDDSLGKSYIHVSDDDDGEGEGSDSTSTPSDTGSPITTAADTQLQQELSIEEEVENALEKKELVQELESIKQGYYIGGAITGVSFVIASIGLVGDLYYF